MTNAKFDEALKNWKEQNSQILDYQISHSMNDDTTVTSTFTVNRDGFVTEVKTTNKTVGKNLATLWRMAKTLVLMRRFKKGKKEVDTEE